MNAFTNLSSRAGRLSATLIAIAALSVTTTGLASSAGAAGIPFQPERAALKDVAASDYLAGYQATPTGGLASASVTFTIPTITCNATDANSSQFMGVFTDTSLATILMECDPSPLYFYYAATQSGSNIEGGARPGDTVVTSLFQSGTSTWAEIHDLTQNVYWFDNHTVNEGDTVVDLGSINDSADGIPVPAFTTVKMTNATVNGDYLGFESPTQYSSLEDGVVLIKSGGLQTSGLGSSFSLTFKHSS